MMRVLIVAMAGLVLSLAASAPAQARTLEDCEKIKDWHAYNTCLASFGPRRGQRAVNGQPQAEDAERRVYRGRKQTARRSVSGLNVQRVAGGRVRATFDVSAPRRARPQ
ncbi:MAG: hypothetical protein NTZ14_09730 [Hyphomicrobiales bacterium]|nr:hypothetical protein [Hyphomicrobiales bacterium]